VFRDPIFGTPIFKVLSGRSTCPHVMNTVPREAVVLTWRGGFNRKTIELLPDEDKKAVIFEMSDTSTTLDTFETVLKYIAHPNASMPLPVQIKVNGDPVIMNQAVICDTFANVFAGGDKKMVMLEVSRSPVATGSETYRQNNNKLQLWSACEYDFAEGEGAPGIITVNGKTGDEILDPNVNPVSPFVHDEISFDVIIHPRIVSQLRSRRAAVGGSGVPDRFHYDGADQSGLGKTSPLELGATVMANLVLTTLVLSAVAYIRDLRRQKEGELRRVKKGLHPDARMMTTSAIVMTVMLLKVLAM